MVSHATQRASALWPVCAFPSGAKTADVDLAITGEIFVGGAGSAVASYRQVHAELFRIT
jgi:hypothetical protein